MTEINNEKFPHLDHIDPKADNILNMPISSINEEHLGTLRDNLSEYSQHKNPNIAKAALIVIGRINEVLGDLDNIIKLGNDRAYAEILNSTSSDDYDDKIAA